MSIHWSRKLLDHILPSSILERFREAQCDPSQDSADQAGYTVPFYNGKTAELLIAMPMVNATRVSRRKMRYLLSGDIDVQVSRILGSSWNSC
jgi:hypothetical protein